VQLVLTHSNDFESIWSDIDERLKANHYWQWRGCINECCLHRAKRIARCQSTLLASERQQCVGHTRHHPRRTKVVPSRKPSHIRAQNRSQDHHQQSNPSDKVQRNKGPNANDVHWIFQKSFRQGLAPGPWIAVSNFSDPTLNKIHTFSEVNITSVRRWFRGKITPLVLVVSAQRREVISGALARGKSHQFALNMISPWSLYVFSALNVQHQWPTPIALVVLELTCCPTYRAAQL
jgi:hypothetical protein